MLIVSNIHTKHQLVIRHTCIAVCSKHSAMIAKKDPGLPKRLPRNGGYALYFAYMLNEAHKKANSSLLHKARALTLGPQAGVLDYKMRYAAK